MRVLYSDRIVRLYLAGTMRPVPTGVVTGHLRLLLLLGLRRGFVVISILLAIPLSTDIVTAITFRKESIAPTATSLVYSFLYITFTSDS